MAFAPSVRRPVALSPSRPVVCGVILFAHAVAASSGRTDFLRQLQGKHRQYLPILDDVIAGKQLTREQQLQAFAQLMVPNFNGKIPKKH